MECYDVAHLQGTDTAGAMVVFEQGVPKKKEYRRFQIRTSGNDDFASMQEMLSRRFKRTAAERAARERSEALTRARAGERDEPAPGDDFEALARLDVEHRTMDDGRWTTQNGNNPKSKIQSLPSNELNGPKSEDWSGWAV